MEKENVLISACLLGNKCRYDGKIIKSELDDLLKYFNLIPFCPEVSGGLPTPRDPSEIRQEKVVSIKNKDVTKNFNSGAFLAESICREKNIHLAILKEESPSCGVYKIFDGTFSNKLIDGKGMTTRRLIKAGIKVINEIEAKELLINKENETDSN